MILQVLIAMVAGWINRHQQHVITYLKEENRLLKSKLPGGLSFPNTSYGQKTRTRYKRDDSAKGFVAQNPGALNLESGAQENKDSGMRLSWESGVMSAASMGFGGS